MSEKQARKQEVNRRERVGKWERDRKLKREEMGFENEGKD